MKFAFTILTISFTLLGCIKENNIDTTPPPPPQGIRTVSLDNSIELQWLASQAEDVKGYNVWVSNQYAGPYHVIISTSSTNVIDYAAVNGTTYYYAVSACDFSGNESDLSTDVIYDTPRPEGYGIILSDTSTNRNSSGYGFAQYRVLSCYDINTDVFFVNVQGRVSLLVWSDTDIQDMGYTSSLDDISSSPIKGWAPSKSAEAIAGHTYVLWTVDDHYAKVRIQNVSATRLVFDWAYQTAKGNVELKAAVARHGASRQPNRSTLK